MITIHKCFGAVKGGLVLGYHKVCEYYHRFYRFCTDPPACGDSNFDTGFDKAFAHRFRWFGTVNHKQIGTLYFYFGVASGCLGFSLRMMMRMNNFRPGLGLLGAEQYLTIVTAHAIIIIFFFVMPMYIGGFGNWLIPLILLAPDMALARINAFRFWVLLPAMFYMLVRSGAEGGLVTG